MYVAEEDAGAIRMNDMCEFDHQLLYQTETAYSKHIHLSVLSRLFVNASSQDSGYSHIPVFGQAGACWFGRFR